MTRHRSFETAAARRRANPIVWEVDGTPIRLRASVDITEVAPLFESLQTPVDEDKSQISATLRRRTDLVATIREFVEEDSHDAFDRVAPDLEIPMLIEMVRDLVEEYVGAKNPTKPADSSAGSSETGASSTAGAEPAASI